MNHRNELILGFEAKETWCECGWDQDSKESYLYRLNLEKVLSMDNSVWNPAFGDLYWITKSHVITFYIGPYGYWKNLVKLEEFLEQYRVELRTKKYYIVLFAMIASVCSLKELKQWGDLRTPRRGSSENEFPANSIELVRSRGMKVTWDDSWKLFGYDIADYTGGFSGISNIGVQT